MTLAASGSPCWLSPASPPARWRRWPSCRRRASGCCRRGSQDLGRGAASAARSRSPIKRQAGDRRGLPRPHHARRVRLHLVPGRVPAGPAGPVGGARQARPPGGALRADPDRRRSRARYAGAPQALRRELPSAPGRPHRHASRDRASCSPAYRVAGRPQERRPGVTARLHPDLRRSSTSWAPDGGYRGHLSFAAASDAVASKLSRHVVGMTRSCDHRSVYYLSCECGAAMLDHPVHLRRALGAYPRTEPGIERGKAGALSLV